MATRAGRRAVRRPRSRRRDVAWVVGAVFVLLAAGLLVWSSTAAERPYRDGGIDQYVGEVVRVGDAGSGCGDGQGTAYEFRFEGPDDTGYGSTTGCAGEHAVGDRLAVWVLPDGQVTTDSPRRHELAARYGAWLVLAAGALAVWLLSRRGRPAE